MTQREEDDEEENLYPLSIGELVQHALKQDSVYHFLSLLSLKVLIWNLDAFLFLSNLLDFQVFKKELLLLLPCFKFFFQTEMNVFQKPLQNTLIIIETSSIFLNRINF